MFMYFPENYMWSLSFNRCLNSGGLMGEMDRIGQRLKEAGRVPPLGDLEVWHAEWTGLAGHVEGLGQQAMKAGKGLTARDAFLRATHYYQWAAAFLPAADPRKKALYQRHLACFAQSAALMLPPVEIVDVPYENTALPAYLVPAFPGTPRPNPAVVFFDGLDAPKEELFPTARLLAERGIACLVVDGPGYGAALILRRIVSRYDYEVPATACYEFLARRPEIDARRIGLMAESMGGYYAPRAVAFEKRFKACVAWGAVFDYHEAWLRRRRLQLDSPVAAPAHYLFDVLGVSTWDEAFERLKPFRLKDIARHIECPILIVHGQDDRQIPLADAHALYSEVGSQRKELKVLTREDGGTAHCQVDQPEPCRSYIADWFAENL